jgi:hypothetical protein
VQGDVRAEGCTVTDRERAEIDRLREVVARQVKVAAANARQIRTLVAETERMLSELEEFVAQAEPRAEDPE